MRHLLNLLPGFALCVLVGVAATALSGWLPLGSVALAILVGILVGNGLRPGRLFGPGLAFGGTHLLSLAIALLGFRLDYALLEQLGWRSLVMIVTALGATLLTAVLLGRLFRIDRRLALLLGVGSGVCGSSAIAAAESVVDAERDQAGIAVAVVNFLGTLGMLVLPLAGAVVLRLDEVPLGILIGNTLQAVGQVTAAGFAVGESAGQAATVVKLGRVLMLTPVLLGLILMERRRGVTTVGRRTGGLPWFIVGFLVCSVVASLHVVPTAWIHVLTHAGHLALLLAMAAIGMRITFASLLRSGGPALGTGVAVFLVQLLFSGLLVRILY